MPRAPRTDDPSDATLPRGAGIIDVDALAALVRELVRAEIARPVHVTQRTVEAVTGMPRGDYLDRARRGSWPSYKDARLVYSKTADVLAYIEAHPVASRPANDADDGEAVLLARVGARRVAP